MTRECGDACIKRCMGNRTNSSPDNVRPMIIFYKFPEIDFPQSIPSFSLCMDRLLSRIYSKASSNLNSADLSGNCENNMYACNNRRCIWRGFVCDSVDNCGDGSDERLCSQWIFSSILREQKIERAIEICLKRALKKRATRYFYAMSKEIDVSTQGQYLNIS